MYLSNQASLKKHCHDATSAILNVSSEEELEEQINAPENVTLEGTSDVSGVLTMSNCTCTK